MSKTRENGIDIKFNPWKPPIEEEERNQAISQCAGDLLLDLAKGYGVVITSDCPGRRAILFDTVEEDNEDLLKLIKFLGTLIGERD